MFCQTRREMTELLDAPAVAAPPARRGYLVRMFRATEEANRQAILRALPEGGGGTVLDLGTHTGVFTERIGRRTRRRPPARRRVHPRARGAGAAPWRPRHRGGRRARPAVRRRDLRRRHRQPDRRAPAADRPLLQRDPPRPEARRSGVRLDEQPVELAQRRRADARVPAEPDARLRRGRPRQPAQPRERDAPPGRGPGPPAPLHRRGRWRSSPSTTACARCACGPSATTRCRPGSRPSPRGSTACTGRSSSGCSPAGRPTGRRAAESPRTSGCARCRPARAAACPWRRAGAA